jgi:hypothetical protein
MAWGDRGEQHNPSEPSEFSKRIKQDWYYNVGGVVPAEGACDQPLPQRVIRVRLTEPLYGCESAKAIHLINTPDESDIESETLTVYDPINTVANALIAVEDKGELYIPAGTCCYAVFVYDSGGIWCAMEYGVCCQGSGSGSEGSEGSGSEGSEGSGSCISGTVCWIGEDCGAIKHKTPQTSTESYADCTKDWKIPSVCGLMVDDAGHVKGWADPDNGYAWYSPWGLPEPGGWTP